MKKSYTLFYLLTLVFTFNQDIYADSARKGVRSLERIIRICGRNDFTHTMKKVSDGCYQYRCNGDFEGAQIGERVYEGETDTYIRTCFDDEALLEMVKQKVSKDIREFDRCLERDEYGDECIKWSEGSGGGCAERGADGRCLRSRSGGGSTAGYMTSGCGRNKCVVGYSRRGKVKCKRLGHKDCLRVACTADADLGDCITHKRLAELSRGYDQSHSCGPNCRDGRGGGFGRAMEGIGKFLLYGGMGASAILGPIMWQKGVKDISAAAQVGFQQCASVQNNYITSYLGGWGDDGNGGQIYKPGYLQNNVLPDRPLDIPNCNGYGIDTFAGLAGLGGGMGMFGLNGMLGAGYSPGMLGLGGLGGQIGLGGVIGTVISGGGGIGAGLAIGQPIGGLGSAIGIAGPIGGGIGMGIAGPIGGGIGIAGPIGGGIGTGIGNGFGIAGPIGGGIGIAGPIGGGIGTGFGIAGPIGGGFGNIGGGFGNIGGGFGNIGGGFGNIGGGFGNIGGGQWGGGPWGGGGFPGGAGGAGLYPWGGGNGFWGANGGFGNMWGNVLAQTQGDYNAYYQDRMFGAQGIQAGNQFQWNMWQGYSPFNMFGQGNWQAGVHGGFRPGP